MSHCVLLPGTRVTVIPVLSEFFSTLFCLKKRKKSFFGGKLLGARPVLVAIWRNFRGVFHARVGRLL